MLWVCACGGWEGGTGIGIIGLLGGDADGSIHFGIGSALASAGDRCGITGTVFIGTGTITGIIPTTGIAPGGPRIGCGMATIATTGPDASGGGGGNACAENQCVVLRILFCVCSCVCFAHLRLHALRCSFWMFGWLFS